MTEEVKAPLRNQEQLNKRYTELCTYLGDSYHKQDLLEADVHAIKQEMAKIDEESRALSKEKKEIEAHNQSVESKKESKKIKAVK